MSLPWWSHFLRARMWQCPPPSEHWKKEVLLKQVIQSNLSTRIWKKRNMLVKSSAYWQLQVDHNFLKLHLIGVIISSLCTPQILSIYKAKTLLPPFIKLTLKCWNSHQNLHLYFFSLSNYHQFDQCIELYSCYVFLF